MIWGEILGGGDCHENDTATAAHSRRTPHKETSQSEKETTAAVGRVKSLSDSPGERKHGEIHQVPETPCRISIRSYRSGWLRRTSLALWARALSRCSWKRLACQTPEMQAQRH